MGEEAPTKPDSAEPPSPSLPQFPWTGRCICGHIRYSLHATPLIIHSCHCHSCQIETGSACAINLVLETSNMKVEPADATLAVVTPSQSGKSQLIHRCPKCFVALYSHYAGSGPYTVFIRLGTLDPPYSQHEAIKPALYIYQESKMPWFVVPEGARQFQKFYRPREEWSEDANVRFGRLMPMVKEWREKIGGWDAENGGTGDEKGVEEKMQKLKLESACGKT